MKTKAAVIMIICIIMVSMLLLGADLKTGFEEKPLPENAIRAVNGGFLNFYQGNIVVIIELPEHYEIEAACDNGAIFVAPKNADDFKIGSESSVTFNAGDAYGFSVFEPGVKNGEALFGSLESDNVTIRLLIRKGNEVKGYAVIAGWDNDGHGSFRYVSVIKAVTFIDKNGDPVSIPEEQVNDLVDSTIEEYILKPGLFASKGKN